MNKIFRSNVLASALIVILGSVLLLYNLDDHALWQDEAETACVSRTISMESFVPKGYDGLNYFSQQRGQEYDENYIWKLHPWCQFYITAGSFFVLGESTFSARLPFVLLGIATVVLSYFLSLLLWNDKKSAWFTVAFFLLSVSFLLLTRQARYYAPVFFFSTYAAYGLFAFLKDKKWALFHFGFATFLLFHSQYLFAIVFWFAAIIYTFTFHKKHLKKLLLLIVLLAVPNLIFLKWLLSSSYGQGFGIGIGLKEGLLVYPRYIIKYLLSPIWLLVPILFLFYKKDIKWREDEKPLLFFLLIVFGDLIGLLLFGRLVFVRYLCGIIPFLFLIKGRLAAWLAKIHLSVPIILILGLVYFSDFSKYIKDIRTETNGPIEGIVGFMEDMAKPEDKIGIGYGDLPLKFYLPNKIYGGLVVDMPAYLDSLDFLVMRQNILTDRDNEVKEAFEAHLQNHLDEYEILQVNVWDLPYECRETPDEHFRNSILKVPKVIIFKKK